MTENCIRFKVRSTNCNTRRTHGRSHHIFINALHSHSGVCGHLLIRNCGDYIIVKDTLSSFLRIPILCFLLLSDAVLPAYKHRYYNVDSTQTNANHFPRSITLNANYICRKPPHLYDKPTKVLKVISTRARISSSKKTRDYRDFPGRR